MRIRTNDLIRMVVAVVVTVWLAACDGGSNVAGGGGIVGTGKQVVSGEVTGFGSVIVNGIEFTRSTDPAVPTTPVVLSFDDVSNAGEGVLRHGMMVTVSGSYDSDTNQGSFSQIQFSPELHGLLDNGSVNAAAGSFTLLGRTVQTGASTIFDGVSDMTELQTRQNQGLELEVSGYLDSGGKVQASRVAIKSSGFTGGKVQLKGLVSSVDNTSFTLGSLAVPISGATFVGMSAADLTVTGLIVEVRGTLSGTTVGNARIERKSATSSVPSGESINIKGVAAGAPVAGSFVLFGPDGPLLITTSAAPFFKGRSSSDASIIVPGARLEVEGAVRADGSLAARKISVETEKTVRLEGDLTSLNAQAGSLTLNGVTATTVISTRYRDSRNPSMAPFGFSGLAAGDHLQVYGFLDGSGRVIATQVERFNASTVNLLQGPVTAINVSTLQLTILGISVTVQPGAVLSKGINRYAGFASFASHVTAGSTVVKAKGSSAGAGFSAAGLEIQP
ncbi:MAG: hypothetical protein H7Y05_12015 [Steroidobacteraceae bacterium]|nr:hypothetical protein [Deltaproteobacteria bacterium]